MSEIEDSMLLRDIPLVNGAIYHIYSKSIADFQIFRYEPAYERIKNLITYYKIKDPPVRYSMFTRLKDRKKYYQRQLTRREKMIEIIAYCIMPTHLHLILKQIHANGITVFMKNILDSYSKYFNFKAKRKGPLWESRFKRVLVKSDEQLLHLTRYIHLNPVTGYLVDKPEDWKYSSYNEFLGTVEEKERVCNFLGILEITPSTYKQFVISQIDYQRQLAKAKTESIGLTITP